MGSYWEGCSGDRPCFEHPGDPPRLSVREDATPRIGSSNLPTISCSTALPDESPVAGGTGGEAGVDGQGNGGKGSIHIGPFETSVRICACDCSRAQASG